MAKKKITKQSKRRLLIFGTISILVIIYFFVSLSYYSVYIYRLKNEEVNLTNDLNDLKHDEKLLKTELEKLQDPDYLARYARENYDYTKDGEYVIKINKEEKEEKSKDKTDIEIYRKYIYIGSTIVLLFIIYIFYKIKKK